MGRHRDPAFERMSRTEQRGYEAAARAAERARRAQDRAERFESRLGRPLGSPVRGRDEDRSLAFEAGVSSQDEFARWIRDLSRQIGAALRAGRARRCLSQRELAEVIGVSQPVVARLESGSSNSSLVLVQRALAAVGVRLNVIEAARPTRRAGEHARDRSGRRLPAHLTPYRLSQPHSWWAGAINALMWHDEPRWSYRRRPNDAGPRSP
jgi:transcriptional regulator with XRE-family HTH domain